jgi:pyoverdine/dityrosine biosynthesis protein Dit1
MTQLELNTVSKALAAAKLVLEQLKPVLDHLNAIYDPAGGAKLTITQDGLNTVPSFSGLTKEQLDDGMYALTTTLRAAVNSAYTQLAQLAARG